MNFYTEIGQQALFGLASHIFFIAVAFYALQAFRFEQLFKKGKTFQIQLVYILFSIVIGSTVSNFFINFSQWSRSLVYIFQ
ncbi:DUF1146 family protein [Lysinibacillus louembei]|uniref:DUF1146 family protein n=1 Tax=Lysinibacillus louembei TaxID=1470088 RepID=A0ABZ0RWA6_9BACI|nr:DUF1146 family protein [Lysinibacillus louembei]WPK12507.1 DUF1146 family protein [Lysinibacillus louembei]